MLTTTVGGAAVVAAVAVAVTDGNGTADVADRRVGLKMGELPVKSLYLQAARIGSRVSLRIGLRISLRVDFRAGVMDYVDKFTNAVADMSEFFTFVGFCALVRVAVFRPERFDRLRFGTVAIRGVGLAVAGQESYAQPACDIIDKALGNWNIAVTGHAGRLKPGVAEFIDQRFHRHTILQRHRDTCTVCVHQTPDGAALLGHGDE